ncbi:ABC transporter substrate-binding protein [Couchioplanes caeruleus]|uniref:ABC transporter substrate-binding protein n=1 Tax=Couchioplanes caeruleus TaxID=56438 RepID=UPI0020C0BA75|nr:ABC transporter substrate-binding protein [Couchioplanes caeruleus]UQU64794.1 ABC transporter substrate-binding protein [Couchioplanes caeruleus]
MRHPYRLAATAALVVMLAACADHGSSAAGDTMTLNVGQISNSVAFFPIFVAEDQGYFKAEGLTLGERPRLGTGAKLAAALQSGSIDVGGGVMTDAFNLRKVNAGTRLVAGLVDEYYVDIIAGGRIPAAADGQPLAARVEALRGKKIGITGPGSGTEALLTYLLKKYGLDPRHDVTAVNLGADPSASLGALKAGRVDALSFFQPIGQQAEAQHTGRIFISPARGDVPELRNALHGVVFTTQKVIDGKGRAMTAFVRAIAKAEQTIHGDPATVEALLQKYQTTMDSATVKALVPVLQAEIPASPAPSETGYATSAAFHRESGLAPSPPSYAEMVPSGWIAGVLPSPSRS